MSISSVTHRFLQCLDQLIAERKVRSKRHFALSIGYHAQGISEMAAMRRDAPLDLIEKAVTTFRFNPVFLFTGIGNPFSNPAEDDGLRLKNLTVVTDQKGEERIVHVPYPAQAGYGRLLDDPVFLMSFPHTSFRILNSGQARTGHLRSPALPWSLCLGQMISSLPHLSNPGIGLMLLRVIRSISSLLHRMLSSSGLSII